LVTLRSDPGPRTHEGWLATLEILEADIGAQVEERELAFEGITDEWDEVQGNTISIIAGGSRMIM